MHDSIKMQRLDCYVVAKELAARVHRAEIRDSELKDQARRASKSAFLQLAEGLPNEGAGMRRKYFTESHNSVHELVAAIDLARDLGVIDRALAGEVLAASARLKAMLYGLLRKVA